MAGVLVEAIASSTAHGISRAAATRYKTVRVMWILLFVICMGMFLNSGISLVLKLRQNKLTKEYHLDQVPFVFPDLYFCPSSPFSGSFPFTLTKTEADLLDAEVQRLIDVVDRLFGYKSKPKFAPVRAFLLTYGVQMAFPHHLLKRYLLVKKQQAILGATVGQGTRGKNVEVKTVDSPENVICFQPILSDEHKQMLVNCSDVLEIHLMTDPYFPDFNFSGYSMRPISDEQNKSYSFLDWHPVKIINQLKASGFSMLIVPPGAYPSLRYENNFHMAPGNEYIVKLSMLENSCSEDLYNTHCRSDRSPVVFANSLTRRREEFNYSTAACLYEQINSILIDKLACHANMPHPLPWRYRDAPRCENASEMTKAGFEKFLTGSNGLREIAEQNATEYCKSRIPCSYPEYSASFSFSKWPGLGSSTAKFFADFENHEYLTGFTQVSKELAPALHQLIDTAKQIDSGSHSAHLEGVFRTYVAESMLNVKISVASIKSSQIMLTWAYTFTNFLADTGGLLGLYIGCSVLTLFELIEIFHHCVLILLQRKSKARHSNAAGESEDEAEEMKVMTRPENRLSDALEG